MELEDLLKSFYNVSKMNMTIFDLNQEVIACFPMHKSPFCRLLNGKKEALSKCIACDYKAMEVVKKTGELYIYKCWCGLYEAIMPLYTYGTLSGYLMMGQVKASEEDINTIISKAYEYLTSEEQAKELLKSTATLTKSQIKSYSNILDICAKYITITNEVDVSSENLAQEVQKYLVKNYKQDISIDFLCNYYHVSKATLNNHFKEEYGTTIHQRLLSIRLNEAQKLLTTTSHSVKEIALEVGFHDSDYFSKAFYKFYGITPTNYNNENE